MRHAFDADHIAASRGLGGAMGSDGSTLERVTGLIGPAISGSFLIVAGLVNLGVLIAVVKVARQMRHGIWDARRLDQELARRGAMHRLFGRANCAVSEPWQMYPLGLLFGLGFDTATEVALLASAGTAAAAGIPFYAVLCLPILFAAGMALRDAQGEMGHGTG